MKKFCVRWRWWWHHILKTTDLHTFQKVSVTMCELYLNFCKHWEKISVDTANRDDSGNFQRAPLALQTVSWQLLLFLASLSMFSIQCYKYLLLWFFKTYFKNHCILKKKSLHLKPTQGLRGVWEWNENTSLVNYAILFKKQDFLLLDRKGVESCLNSILLN